MISPAFVMTGPKRESGNHFHNFGVLDWESQFVFWHSMFVLWWIWLIVLIQESPDADVDYGCAG
jgi:hypothetical protein